jgi:hypothetical protein
MGPSMQCLLESNGTIGALVCFLCQSSFSPRHLRSVCHAAVYLDGVGIWCVLGIAIIAFHAAG